MNKTDLVKEFKEGANLANLKDAKEILGVLGDIIISHMKDEDGVTPWSGVKFIAEHKEARTARNPQTGEAINVPAKYVPRVRFGKAVKDALN